MAAPRPDPHTDFLLDALPRPWTLPANDAHPCAPLRGVAWGVLFGVLLWSALGLVALWCWR